MFFGSPFNYRLGFFLLKQVLQVYDSSRPSIYVLCEESKHDRGGYFCPDHPGRHGTALRSGRIFLLQRYTYKTVIRIKSECLT